MKILEVTWVDATRGDDVFEEPSTLSTRRTVGWVVDETDEFVTLAMSRDVNHGKEEFDRWFTIPTAYITLRRRL